MKKIILLIALPIIVVTGLLYFLKGQVEEDNFEVLNMLIVGVLILYEVGIVLRFARTNNSITDSDK